MAPQEFAPAAVAAAVKAGGKAPYADFLNSGEPMASLLRNNPWTALPNPDKPLQFGQGWYYDTTVARKHPYWKDKQLPTPTKDLQQLRRDLFEWGYCLIEEGLSQEQTAALRQRCDEQAAAERVLGLAQLNVAQQHLWGCANKGEIFLRYLEYDPEVVQAAPLIEQINNEFLGHDWIHYSLVSNISYPGCFPQGLHQDQTFIQPYYTETPALLNTILILEDVNEVNGGTLIIPGSHKVNRGPGDAYGKLPPTINMEAKAGTILMTDGRLLHGGAVNRSDKLRIIMTNSTVKPWVRQQENFLLSTSPEVLNKASDKLLMRLGFQATTTRGIVEGYGYRGHGGAGDPNGSIVHIRRAMDSGNYQRVGHLTLEDAKKGDVSQFTLASIQKQHETYRRGKYLERMAKI